MVGLYMSHLTIEELKFLDSVQSELYKLTIKYNAMLKSQITSSDLDEPDYHDFQTVQELNDFVQSF